MDFGKTSRSVSNCFLAIVVKSVRLGPAAPKLYLAKGPVNNLVKRGHCIWFVTCFKHLNKLNTNRIENPRGLS
ncbi:hypothetical protein GGR42_002321 [Saonia flava]|uniref:Uncharacterized protein n=1 Tax=Saonia flava TaxID=523696 RepID=A0A846R4Y7_9FLAO|nr:hypothetical protein [Saonia flava]